MAGVLTQIQTTLTLLPQCAVSSASVVKDQDISIMRSSRLAYMRRAAPSLQSTVILDGITRSTCGLDIACVCRDDEFLTSLQSDLATSCDRDDQAATFAVAKDLCLSAIPSLAEDPGGELVATVTVLMVVATVAVVLRLYARRISGAKFGTDDFLIIVALILTWGLDINSYYAIKAGTGKHMITLSLDKITSFVKTYQATQILFGCSITATKLSILFFYNRLFPYRTFYLVSLITGIASILWWIGLMITAFLHCRPFAYNWDRSIPGGHCSNDKLVGYTITSINIVTDLVVLVLPIPWLWGMNMAVPKRMAVVCLFVLGSFVCIAGIIRIPFLSDLQISDATYTSIKVGVWVSVECNIGVVSACLPILRPLFSSKYTASPLSHLTRLFRFLTNNHRLFSSSSRENLTSDPEKGGTSEPSSDATLRAEQELRWPNDSRTAGVGGGWKWSRNNSGADSISQAPHPQGKGSIPMDYTTTVGTRRIIPLGDKERQRKQRTWYTAAAEMLPEFDLQKNRWSRKVIDTDAIPRYRDDVGEKKAVVKGEEEEEEEKKEEEKEKEENIKNFIIALPPAPLAASLEQPSYNSDQRPLQKTKQGLSLLDGTIHENKSRRSSHGQRRWQNSIPSTARQSRRSSWGLGRDTWDLMPSIAFWERGGLGKVVGWMR
ncbi:MAG: hypothetical protein Q9168_007229 [Polycauliona sp. 1 TL-2023]